jgi:hypothetical protein
MTNAEWGRYRSQTVAAKFDQGDVGMFGKPQARPGMIFRSDMKESA